MSTINYMQAGKSVSFSFVGAGKKVHYVPTGWDLLSRTVCGLPNYYGINYPIQRQKKNPDICKTCKKLWETK